MLREVVTNAPYSHHFEVVPVCHQDVATSCLHISALSHPIPHLHMTVMPYLPKAEEEVHQPELQHQVGDLLAARVMGLGDVGAEVP